MKIWIALSLAAATLSGCNSVPYEGRYGASGYVESQCAAIRQFVPLQERGTRADPTTSRSSLCYGTAPVEYRTGGIGADSPFFPLRAFVDAANTN
ncbi:hypothetical protein GCM10011390_36270 [Aureimonas endophytica]|uniref:Lipoprotein n=1 Tax=Aureimonas endophytica TaxID=2027858 RepID=A0A916ZU33_9HYPH|nr:hypothetical protein [Aureimonas endophytica]GGE13880.1 hypothetical protein GCM10011390_36270 [Aureimonas endophytica]